jgi:hypothetical protein
MRESTYQSQLIKRLKGLFPGCVILRNDPEYIQGIPDLLILFEDMWAALEVKISEIALERPNQAYYVDLLNGMSFAAFIFPENEEEVLHALQQTFESSRHPRLSKR